MQHPHGFDLSSYKRRVCKGCLESRGCGPVLSLCSLAAQHYLANIHWPALGIDPYSYTKPMKFLLATGRPQPQDTAHCSSLDRHLLHFFVFPWLKSVILLYRIMAFSGGSERLFFLCPRHWLSFGWCVVQWLAAIRKPKVCSMVCSNANTHDSESTVHSHRVVVLLVVDE